MKDFMLLVKGDGSDSSPEQMQVKLENYRVWMIKWKETGNYVSGAPFETAGHLLLGQDTLLAQGDFLDPKETIGGYIHILANDLEEATAIAKECPLLDGCGIYVRPFLNMN
ncbi:MAG: hypothetical protein KI790_10160 [Cyclobacteriaceae bacterium]|nr:hypothetical protein [Cyclobacteriaceae bacterium HetDA_MAG_MS6]